MSPDDLVERWRAATAAAATDDNDDGDGAYTLLREHRGKRLWRYRFAAAPHDTLIVKTWQPERGPWWRRVKRRLVGERSGADNEYAMLEHLARHAPLLAVPTPMARLPHARLRGETVEAALLEDLGPCDTGTAYVKRALDGGDAAALARIERFVVDSLQALLDADVVDDDHSLINIVHAPSRGSFHRIDFEVAQRLSACRRPEHAVGDMLGRLLATHTFACQPDTAPTTRLAAALRAQLTLPPSVWRRAQATAQDFLQRQQRRTGIDTRPDLSPLGR